MNSGDLDNIFISRLLHEKVTIIQFLETMKKYIASMMNIIFYEDEKSRGWMQFYCWRVI